jgi:hypothetical protein
MYYTELDPFTGKAIFVEKEARRKEHQKEIVTNKDSKHNPAEKQRKTGGHEGASRKKG